MTVYEPYSFVRFITVGLATLWTILGFVRLFRFGHRWEKRLRTFGFSRRWFTRQVMIVAVRTTVLDPVNLALFCLLLGLWSVRTAI